MKRLIFRVLEMVLAVTSCSAILMQIWKSNKGIPKAHTAAHVVLCATRSLGGLLPSDYSAPVVKPVDRAVQL